MQTKSFGIVKLAFWLLVAALAWQLWSQKDLFLEAAKADMHKVDKDIRSAIKGETATLNPGDGGSLPERVWMFDGHRIVDCRAAATRGYSVSRDRIASVREGDVFMFANKGQGVGYCAYERK